MPLQDMASIRYSAALESLKENNELILCLQLNNCQIDDERVSKVHSIIEFLKNERRTIDSSKLAVELKEISLLASQELSLPCQKGVSSPVQVEYSEGVRYFAGNLHFFISILDMDPCHRAMGAQGAGLHRIALVELLCNVVLPCLPIVEEDVLSSGVLVKLLKLFIDFPQNSILHCAVFRCLQAILRPSTEFFWSLVRDACLPSFLAREGTKCAAVLQQGRRPSYCGHIFALSKTLNDLGGSDADIMDFLNKSKEWTSYVAPDGSFRKMQAEQSGDLCGPRPVLSRLVTNFLQNPARNLVQVNQFTV